jgi:excinuclease ABC subunit B
MWQGDTDQSRVTAKVEKPKVGQNLAAHLDALRTAMRKAAENLEFEEAARLRDEVKRLEAVELAVADDPLARQSETIEEAVEEAVKMPSAARTRRTRAPGLPARRQFDPPGPW